MFSYKWKMPAVATTCIILIPFGYEGFKVLVGKRSDNSDAFPGAWAFPGGFLDVGEERVIDAASREVLEETGVKSSDSDWNLFYIDDLFREDDPRQDHVVNICYYGIFDERIYEELSAGDDLQELKWVDLDEVRSGGFKLAFTHNKVSNNLPFPKLSYSR